MEILGIFRDVDSAACAVDRLIKAGFAEAQITSLSSVPYPDGVLVKTGQRSWFRWMSLAGGVFGAFAGFGLAVGTAWLYPVQTGDKPIVALYPAAIISFEVAMVSAIIGCMAGMFLEMRLPSFREHPYDASISEGNIGISLTIYSGGEAVACESALPAADCIGASAALTVAEQKELAEQVMRCAGAQRVIGEKMA